MAQSLIIGLTGLKSSPYGPLTVEMSPSATKLRHRRWRGPGLTIQGRDYQNHPKPESGTQKKDMLLNRSNYATNRVILRPRMSNTYFEFCGF